MHQFTVLSGQNHTNFFSSEIDHIRNNRIHAGLPSRIEFQGQQKRLKLILARNKNKRDSSSIADSSHFIGHKAFDCSKIDFLLKSLAKLYYLIKLLDDMKTRNDLPSFENNSIKSPSKPPRLPNKRNIVIIAAFPVKQKIIKWVNEKSI